MSAQIVEFSAKSKFYIFLSAFCDFYFLFLPYCPRTSSPTLNESGEKGHICLILNVSGKAFTVSSFKIMLIDSFVDDFIM